MFGQTAGPGGSRPEKDRAQVSLSDLYYIRVYIHKWKISCCNETIDGHPIGKGKAVAGMCGDVRGRQRINRYTVGLLKNAHLSRCAAILVNRRTQKYASFLGFCAPYIWTFLNSPLKIEFFNRPTVPGIPCRSDPGNSGLIFNLSFGNR